MKLTLTKSSVESLPQPLRGNPKNCINRLPHHFSPCAAAIIASRHAFQPIAS